MVGRQEVRIVVGFTNLVGGHYGIGLLSALSIAIDV